jgi:hypothetical protein
MTPDEMLKLADEAERLNRDCIPGVTPDMSTISIPLLAGALRDVVKESLELSDRLRRALCRVMEMDAQAQSGVFDIDLREWWEANKTEEDESHLRMVAALKG